MLSHLAFTAAFGNTIYYLHFTEKEVGPERLLNSWPRVISLVSGRDEIQTQAHSALKVLSWGH